MTTNTQRVAVITGGSSGIGLETAKALAARGWRVIATGRNPERCARARDEIAAVSTSGVVDMLQADLALMSDTARLASRISAITDRIDVLINNAGGMATEKVMTTEGLEESFAGNHLGPFLLTNCLLPLLKETAVDAPVGSVRILNTSSDASEMVPGLNLGDLQNLQNYNVGLAYCSSKLANVLFTRALAERLANDGIVAHCMHPGTVGTNFFSDFDDEAMSRVSTQDMKTPKEGADTLIWLATAEEPGRSSGGYFCNRAPREPNPAVDDATMIERFWEESEELVARALSSHL